MSKLVRGWTLIPSNLNGKFLTKVIAGLKLLVNVQIGTQWTCNFEIINLCYWLLV